MNRITLDQVLMENAVSWAKRGTCTRKYVGAVIAVETRVVSTGYVGAPHGMPHCLDAGCTLDPVTGGCIRTLHAESNAIAFAARKGISLEGGVLYVTLSPCLPCAKLIIASGIVGVKYLDRYRDTSGVELLQSVGVSVDQYDRDRL